MTENAPILPKAFAVRFASVKRWDPNSFHAIEWHWPLSVMKPIGSVLVPRKEKVDRNNNGFSELMPITIHFDGSIEPRKVSGDKEYTMDLFWVRPGDIVASKIDLKNGAVAVIPDNWNTAVVTNHFAVYEPDLNQIVPKYFHMLIQAQFFKEHLWRNKVGAEGRKEVKLEFFESQEIPIPPPPIQQKIVAYWEKETQKIDDELCALEQAESQITLNILSGAGIKINLGKQLPPVLRKRFSDFERWGVGFNRYSWKLSNLITSSSFDCSPLSHFAWINPAINLNLDDSDLVSFIPMEAVDDKDGIVSAAKTKKLIQVKSGYTRFMEGDVLWAKITPCMQNGKSAVVQDLMNGVGFGSTEFHILRSKNKDFLRNEFIHLILRLPEIRRAAMRYFVGSAGQQRVPKEFLEDLHFPIPPINLQFQLIKKMDIERKSIRKMRASILKSKINLGVITEKLILGSLSVEGL